MVRIFIRSILVLIMIISSTALDAQYNAENVMEKSFERMDFFFTSNYLNPYGMGNFTTATPGLIDDPLLKLIINPAYGYHDSTRNTYLFLDFRNTRVERDNQSYYYPRLYYEYSYLSSSYWPYPNYYINARKTVEPVFSGAIFTKPLPKLLKEWYIGFTYQVIYQDNKYYQIPQDIYRSNIGYDYAGNRTAESGALPITDRYNGADDMHEKGHMLSAYSGFEMFNRFQFGAKVAWTGFTRDGAYGSRDYRPYSYYDLNPSLYYRMEERDQQYDHWDVAGGINIKWSENTTTGGMVGYLSGDVIQNKTNVDSSFSSYGTESVGDNWSRYFNAGRTKQRWEHNGSGWYGGLNLDWQISPQKLLHVSYQQRRQDVDIVLNSSVRDTSYSSYHNKSTNYEYISRNNYGLFDDRFGDGTQKQREHRLRISLRWKLEEKKKLNIGLVVHHKKRNVYTSEHVTAFRQNWRYWKSIDNYSNDENERYNSTDEHKRLRWDFQARQLTIHIPIIFTWEVSRTVDLLMGIDRTMTDWDVRDRTFARFYHRTNVYNDQSTTKENFGERYIMPPEIVSDTRTALLGGMVIRPSEMFNIRLLVVPNFENTSHGTDLVNVQWWIGLNLYP